MLKVPSFNVRPGLQTGTVLNILCLLRNEAFFHFDVSLFVLYVYQKVERRPRHLSKA